MAVWSNFGYKSLFEEAFTLADSKCLTVADRELFDRLGASGNFEQALHDLAIAEEVIQSIIPSSDEVVAQLHEAYSRIKTALIETVHKVHVSFGALPRKSLDTIREELRGYGYIFSLNYDLLIYWSLMQNPSGFIDMFDHGLLNQSWARGFNGRTQVYYVHGGLHLYRWLHSGTMKSQNSDGASLLRLFGQPLAGRLTLPVFVSEGSAQEKLQTIRGSDYLSFAYQRLCANQEHMVIFGTSLGDMDMHLIDAINKCENRAVAVGILPGDASRVVRMKTRMRGLLEKAGSMWFFDSTTHPLGSPSLHVT